MNEQLLAAMTKPAPPIATLVPTAPLSGGGDRRQGAGVRAQTTAGPTRRSMQQAVRGAYQALVGTAPAGVRLSFDDAGTVPEGHAADTIAASTKVLTSLSLAGDSPSIDSAAQAPSVVCPRGLGALGGHGVFRDSRGWARRRRFAHVHRWWISTRQRPHQRPGKRPATHRTSSFRDAPRAGRGSGRSGGDRQR